MKKIWVILLLIAIFCVPFFSKWNDYQNEVKFYQNDDNFIIEKIVEYRGIKVFYRKDEFFYLSSYKGILLEVGDSIFKKKQKMTVYSNGVLKGYGEIIKPKETYLEYQLFLN